jgi:hypothetical protein
VSEANRQDIAAPEAKPPRLRSSSAPDSGADYFATDVHYRSLSARVADAVRRSGRFVLVVGDPPPAGVMILSALGSAAAGQFAILGIACGCEFGLEDLLRAVPFGSSGPTAVPPRPPLLVLDTADLLSDAQFEGAFALLMPRDRPPIAALMLGTSVFRTRLKRLKPEIFDSRLTVPFSLCDLASEEIEPFVRRQLQNDDEAKAFNAAAIGAIADFSGGHPALVNRLARIMLANPDWAGGEEEKKPGSLADQP